MARKTRDGGNGIFRIYPAEMNRSRGGVGVGAGDAWDALEAWGLGGFGGSRALEAGDAGDAWDAWDAWDDGIEQ
jgi:hypothetical protein